MSSKRSIIESFRQKLRERNADSNFSNQFLYNVLLEHAKWLIKREISAGRIYSNSSFFQTLSCLEVIETSTIDECCPVKTNCKIYRTKHKLPELWIDSSGPVIRSVSSIDGSTDFFYTNATTWQSKKKDPYQQMSSVKYSFFADGYIWLPEHNPHLISVEGFYIDDISNVTYDCEHCQNKSKECKRFLDTEFKIPGWLQAEMFSKALEQMAGITEKLPEDVEINKNDKRKG